jgi:hypothetical protein
MIGSDYLLLTSTKLPDWQLLVVTNPAVMRSTLTETNQIDTQRFYRVELGP